MVDDDTRALARAMRLMAEHLISVGEVDRAETYLRQAAELLKLDVANHDGTVPSTMVSRQPEPLKQKLPSYRDLAAWLGCTHGFLSQCRSGQSRIRRSWAEQIASVRPDLPATRKTWPKGWAPE